MACVHQKMAIAAGEPGIPAKAGLNLSKSGCSEVRHSDSGQ